VVSPISFFITLSGHVVFTVTVLYLALCLFCLFLSRFLIALLSVCFAFAKAEHKEVYTPPVDLLNRNIKKFILHLPPYERSTIINHFIQIIFSRTILVTFMCSLTLLLTTSCVSSKPSVITTKAAAAKVEELEKKTTPKKLRTVKAPAESEQESKIEKDTVSDYAVSSNFIDQVIENAMRYKGVKYRYGGLNEKGMDCSGLVYTAFQEAGKSVPRTSRSIAATAATIDLDKVRKGDFLFFATGKNKKQVNHVGLITNLTPGEIEFIHATSSNGVLTSTLNEAYWINSFLKAGRIE
jgi:cell wall-associated NlpC family hydrolase